MITEKRYKNMLEAYIIRGKALEDSLRINAELLAACKKALEIVGCKTSPFMDIPTMKILTIAITKAEGGK